MKKSDNLTPWKVLDQYRGTSFNGEWPTLKELFDLNTERFGDNECWKEFTPEYISFTYREAREKIRTISSYLLSLGVEKGEKIIVSGKNSVAWAFGYMAVIYAGCTVVPLDNSLYDDDFETIGRFSDATILIADKDRAEKLSKRLSLKATLSLEKGSSFPCIMDLEAEYREGHKVTEDDLAAILFTSGTTGTPKGVMLTHRNFVADSFLAEGLMQLYPTDVFYAILPIHHAYTMLAVFIESMTCGACCVFGKKLVVSQMMKELKEAKVTMFLGVPMIFNKLYAGLMAGIRKKGKFVYGLIRMLMSLSGWLKRNFGINVGKKWFGFLLKQLSLDTNRICICGGGALPEETFRGFNQLGIDFVQGYGLTETSPITHLNPIWAYIESSVGRYIPGTETKIVDPDGDGNGVIYIRGPQVMQGYYKNPEATREILSDDGWLNTGDVGHVDADGYLYLTGRAKSIIVTEGGKNVFPEEIEDKFQLYSEIENICIIGYMKDKAMKTEGVRAVIYPTKEYSKAHSKEDAQVRMEEIVSEVNRNLQSYKKISLVSVVDEPLEMTSTRKIKRFAVAKKYSLD